MKYNIEPTQKERVMREDDFLVSKTDLKGKITYGNRTFIEFSGFEEHELLDVQHNIVRHPDMPRGVFKFLWDTIGSEKECCAYVKNMSKDGSFYWVFANVTPDYDSSGRVTGYFSVRRCPKRSAVDAIADVYRAMLAEEQKAGPKDACDASIGWLVNVLTQKGVSYEEFILSI